MSEQSRRDQLLDRVVDYVLEHGVADLTLRDLAAAVGSNNRMLIYYFGSRDELIHTALESAAARFPRMVSLFEVLDDTANPPAIRFHSAWDLIGAQENLPFHRLFFQVLGLAGFAPDRFAGFLATVGSEWSAHVQEALVSDGWDPIEAMATAHAVVATWRGLQLTLLSGGDPVVVAEAARRSIEALVVQVAESAV
ncbi:TetR/AcrR family transcriptional regulator [Branchiibius sp. NY16-3462-2]|uniref:TetR/AcrR family transcriptional regulator n=1 Tax=Branchiibius sp. NY16-3462-2 TaxID=1807500 RepID=UPI00079CA326|nr:TetR/AcrR family transcriptional regulator [Branchiibius sp. NY16-3462-2]KYH45667.1 hypothetical protein AZH51_18320 [Branchiibius sp. NY16-3462-2]